MEQQWEQNRSNYPLLIVGQADQRVVRISQEERDSHFHILGTTGEGKSKLIEHLIRGDIKQGNPVFFLDPTDRAETAYSILKYCAKIGFEKVVLIDPHLIHSHNRVCTLQPFHYQKTYKNATVSSIADTVRVLFQTRDAAETPRIQRYISAILHSLWNAEMTLHEAVYFTEYRNPLYQARRRYILGQSDELDRHRLALEEVFTTRAMFLNEFQSTVRRLEPFFDSTLDLMFGADKGIDFIKLITEGWVVLVNLYSGMGFEPIHTRLLGTTVINELIFALDRLRGRGWKGVSYLYIDEAGRYANRNLADLLAYKRKSGLRVTVAHQYFGQFEDKQVLDAVKNLTKIKVMFDTPNPSDRMEMIKALGYGGNIPPVLANYANQDLPKQYAIIKKPKQPPVRVKITDVPEVKMKQKVLDDFIFKLIANNEYYRHPDDIRKQFEQRFGALSPRKGKRADRPADSHPIWDHQASSAKAPAKNGRKRASKKGS
ncbi:MAG TPA: hypothetical protein VJS44_12985 [Pyrinomonadaceae bacterium]|nr:hypothetical protein [Pyrinomonadaceae bacterium]